jgi:xanthine dehydrogenase YagR molybdenum-binding subunit
VASWEDGSLTVYLSTQSVRSTAKKLAKRLGLDASAVRVIAEHVGGAFGAKQGLPDPSVAAALLAREAGAPVRIAFDIAEELTYGGYRPGADIDLAVLGASDGSLQAVAASGYMDGGDSAGQTVVGLMRLSYPGPPMALADYDVVSNGAPAKPFQAPGAPIALFALETAVDELAARFGTDPIALRLGWEPRAGRRALYEWAAAHPLWQQRAAGDRNGDVLRGVGVAFGTWHYVYDPATRVRVSNTADGLAVETGGQDIGTGSAHSLATTVARRFGVTPGDVEVRIGDSALGHGPTSSGSRMTPSLVPTAGAAAVELQAGLVRAAQENLGMGGAAPVDGGLNHAGEFVPWADLWPQLPEQSASAKRPRDDHFPATFVAIEGVKFGWGITDAAHLVAVEADRRSGRVRATKAAAALAAGTIHTPVQARSQVHGAFARGIGQALLEARITDPATGIVSTGDYDAYHLLRMSQMPEVDVEFLDGDLEHVPANGAGIAELAITSVPAAVANAVSDATSWRPRALPMTPEAVLAGLAGG